MNETIKSIFERRSIRDFGPEQIGNEDLELILDAGRYAASAGNMQPWHFTVVQNSALLEKIAQETRRLMLLSESQLDVLRAQSPDFSNFYHAPTVIIVSGDKKNRFAYGDCADAVQNMAVAAHSLNLGSCYIASFLHALSGENGPALIAAFGLPDGFEPYFSLALGYKTGPNPPAPERNKNVVNYIK